MKRKLLLVNALLAGLLILAGAELYGRFVRAEARYADLDAATSALEVPAAPAAPALSPVRSAAFLPIVNRLLFFPDRNATVVIEPPAPAPPAERPDLPSLSGLVDFGDGPSALMAAPGDAPKWVAVGEEIGEYVFAGLVENGGVKLLWNGEEVVIAEETLEAAAREPRQEKRRQPTRAAAPSPPPAPAREAPKRIGGDHNIGHELRPGVFAADPKDTAPDGTVYQEYVKRVRRTPFGSQSWWEKKE